MKISKNTLLISLLLIGGGCYYLFKKKYKNIINNSVYDPVISFRKKVFTKQQIIDDVDFVLRIVEKYHVSAINKLPDEVIKQKKLEIQNLSERINQLEAYRIFARILARLHDAHSQCWLDGLDFKLPFDVKVVDDKFFCTNAELKDAEILQINGKTVSEIYEVFKQHISYEIEEWPYCNFFKKINFEGFIGARCLVLSDIDILKPITVAFRNNNESIFKKTFDLVPIYPSYYAENSEKNFNYNIDKKNNVGIFSLDSCDYSEDYRNVVDDFFKEIGENNIKNIIVDLRNNGGGNSIVTEYFAAYIKNLDLENLKGQYSKVEVRAGDKVITFSSKFDFDNSIGQGLANFLRQNNYLFDGKIYIATSNITFSSAMNFATFFSDNNLATIVGEVPGNSPTCFGDNSPTFKTPNSQISFNTTYKKFYRTDPTKDPDRLIPDVQVEAKNAITRIYELMKN